MVFSDRQVKAAIEPYLPSVKKQQVKHRKVGGVWFGFFFKCSTTMKGHYSCLYRTN